MGSHHRSLCVPAARPRGAARRAAAAAIVAGLAGWLLLLGCASGGPEPEFEDIKPADELYADGLEELEGFRVLGLYTYVDYDAAIEIFQSIIDNYPFSALAVDAEMQIADAYFEAGKYEEALTYYRDFGDLHPQHPKVAYTIYRSALCHESQKAETNRDQTPTRNAIGFLDTLLSRYPNSEYAKEAETLWRELQTGLAENVEGIADFYRSREEYEAAAERYRSLLNDYPGLGLDARVLFKLGLCYESLNRHDEADRIYRTIVAHYAESEYAFDAKRRIAAN